MSAALITLQAMILDSKLRNVADPGPTTVWKLQWVNATYRFSVNCDRTVFRMISLDAFFY